MLAACFYVYVFYVRVETNGGINGITKKIADFGERIKDAQGKYESEKERANAIADAAQGLNEIAEEKKEYMRIIKNRGNY